MLAPRPSVCLRSSRRAAATLVELLVAIAIAVLVLALVFSAYHTVTSLAGRQRRARRLTPAQAALETLCRELACALPPAGPGRPGLRATISEGLDRRTESLEFLTQVVPPEERDLRWAEVQQVRYTLRPAVAPQTGFTVCRAAESLQGTNSVAQLPEQVLLPGVGGFWVELFDGEGWTNAWPGAARPLPQAARISCIVPGRGGAVTLATEVVIAAGRSLER
ncbi:MAG: type II secretion system protein [Kiritimatiellae bacterium]|nr:type II secretion system protein [Kiritimatiellia bacterium]